MSCFLSTLLTCLDIHHRHATNVVETLLTRHPLLFFARYRKSRHKESQNEEGKKKNEEYKENALVKQLVFDRLGRQFIFLVYTHAHAHSHKQREVVVAGRLECGEGSISSWPFMTNKNIKY